MPRHDYEYWARLKVKKSKFNRIFDENMKDFPPVIHSLNYRFSRENAVVINKLESISIVDGGGILNSNMPAATTTTAAAAVTTASYNNNNNNNKLSGRTLSNGTSSNAITNQSQRQTQNARRSEDNVIRLPRGPDGSSGFLLKR